MIDSAHYIIVNVYFTIYVDVYVSINDDTYAIVDADVYVIIGVDLYIQVCIFFDNHLLRGNRARKVSADTLDAFDSPNFPPLASLEVNVKG